MAGLPRLIRPMLVSLRHELPADEESYGWELKWDGLRAIAYVSGDAVRLVSRNDKDMAPSYPELGVLAERVSTPVILDGEIVALRGGRPDFGLLQSRMHVQQPDDTLLRRAHPAPAELARAPDSGRASRTRRPSPRPRASSWPGSGAGTGRPRPTWRRLTTPPPTKTSTRSWPRSTPSRSRFHRAARAGRNRGNPGGAGVEQAVGPGQRQPVRDHLLGRRAPRQDYRPIRISCSCSILCATVAL